MKKVHFPYIFYVIAFVMNYNFKLESSLTDLNEN